MGGNGSKASGILEDPNKRNYQTILDISSNIKVIEQKNKNLNVKLPEESHTPNRIYVVINKPATDRKGLNDPYAGKLKSVAEYGDDCRKLYEIHFDHSHNGMSTHYHTWENGHPVKSGTGKHSPNTAHPLTPKMKKLIEQIINKVPHV